MNKREDENCSPAASNYLPHLKGGTRKEKPPPKPTPILPHQYNEALIAALHYRNFPQCPMPYFVNPQDLHFINGRR